MTPSAQIAREIVEKMMMLDLKSDDPFHLDEKTALITAALDRAKAEALEAAGAASSEATASAASMGPSEVKSHHAMLESFEHSPFIDKPCFDYAWRAGVKWALSQFRNQKGVGK